MRALTATGYGPVSNLKITEVSTPVLGPGQALVKVAAAALNPLDVKLLLGFMHEVLPVTHPLVPGMDVAGTVVEAAGGFAAGDRVVAFLPPPSCGGLAEYAAVDVAGLAKLPDELGFVEAATLPVAGLTALTLARSIEPGRIFVIGASGGIGSFLVQLLAREGASVVATARPEDAERLLRLGAERTVGYTEGQAVAELRAIWPDGADVVVDLFNSGPDVLAGLAAARDGGLLLSPTFGPDATERGIEVRYQGMDRLPGELAELAAADLIHEVGETHPFDEAETVFERYVTAHRSGKTVVTF